MYPDICSWTLLFSRSQELPVLVSGLCIHASIQEQYSELQTGRLLHILKDKLLQDSALFFFLFKPSFPPLQSYEIKDVHLY